MTLEIVFLENNCNFPLFRDQAGSSPIYRSETGTNWFLHYLLLIIIITTTTYMIEQYTVQYSDQLIYYR